METKVVIMKKLLTIVTLLLCSLLTSFAQGSMSGSGTESDPYKIYYPDQLDQIRNFLNQEGVVLKLMNDIDISAWNEANNPGQGWEPIGVQSAPFKGVFDGNDKKITGFSINRGSTDYVGFFGYISGATIKNLTIEGNVIGKEYVGAFVGGGSMDVLNTLTGLKHIGSTTGVYRVGGIAGACAGNFSNLTVSGNVTGSNSDVGGAIGRAGDVGNVSNITVTGDVKNTSLTSVCTGGIVGYSNLSISSSTYSGIVTGGSWVGGIVGSNFESDELTLFNCYACCDVIGNGDYIGGILGRGFSDISHCSFFGNVLGVSYIGGVVGGFIPSTASSPIIRKLECSVFSGGDGKDCIGSAVKGNAKYIKNCYAVGGILATGNYAGGICGLADNGKVSYNITKHGTADCGEYSYNFKYYILYTNGSHRKIGLSDVYKKAYSYSGGTYTYHYYMDFYLYTPIICDVYITDNYFSGKLRGEQCTGGIVGKGNKVSVTHNYSNANITGSTYIGGIIGNVQGGPQEFQYYDYDSATPKTYYTSSPLCDLKSNMALNTSLIASNHVGCIYGSKGSDNVTVGVNGNASEDNRVLYDTHVVLSGVTQEMTNSEQNGVSNGAAYFKLKANYVSHGWDFPNNWTNLETETYPYKPWQAAPPTINSNTLLSGNTSINGNGTDGGTVYVKVGNNDEISTTCSGTSWTLSGLSPLNSGANVSAYMKVKGKENSYRTQAVVSFPGSGTEADPWRVYSADDLQGVYKGGYYKQMNDIDLTSWISANSSIKGWVPVGFNGDTPIIYDGNNYKVTGLWVNSSDNYTGLFSNFSKGTIRNLTVEATAKQVRGGNYAAIVIGRIGEGVIENVTAMGNVSAGNYVGGIAGYTAGTTLNQLSYTGQLTATGWVGGITSYSTGAPITKCEAKDVTIKASSSAFAGGLTTKNTGTITECATYVTITNACSEGRIAGLVAENSGTIKRCLVTGTVNSTGINACTGGLVAEAKSGSVIEDCYSTANVSGTKWTAGLVAYNFGKINHCYSSGNVMSTYYGAGLVGENNGSTATTTNSVALGSKVDVSDQTGWGIRVVGNFTNSAPEPNQDNLLAWVGMQVSVNGIPKNIPDNNLDGTAITTAQTKSRDTYETLGWEFDNVWVMPTDGYPVLKWQVESTEPEVKKGDLNGDGKVSITDIVMIIDVIAGIITDTNQMAVADVNGDGRVTITDCTSAIDLIAAQSSVPSQARRKAHAMLSNTDFISGTMEDNLLTISLDNQKRYTAFQMIVNVPEGMTLGKATMDGMRGADHQVSVRNIGGGRYLVAGFSSDNDELIGNSGHLLSIVTNGQATGDIVISDIEFATTQPEAYYLADEIVNTIATGIDGTLMSDDRGTVYDLSGRKWLMFNGQQSMLPMGVYIVNGKKINLK